MSDLDYLKVRLLEEINISKTVGNGKEYNKGIMQGLNIALNHIEYIQKERSEGMKE